MFSTDEFRQISSDVSSRIADKEEMIRELGDMMKAMTTMPPCQEPLQQCSKCLTLKEILEHKETSLDEKDKEIQELQFCRILM